MQLLSKLPQDLYRLYRLCVPRHCASTIMKAPKEVRPISTSDASVTSQFGIGDFCVHAAFRLHVCNCRVGTFQSPLLDTLQIRGRLKCL